MTNQEAAQEIASIDIEDFPALYELAMANPDARKAIMLTIELCEIVVNEGAYSTTHSFNRKHKAEQSTPIVTSDE